MRSRKNRRNVVRTISRLLRYALRTFSFRSDRFFPSTLTTLTTIAVSPVGQKKKNNEKTSSVERSKHTDKETKIQKKKVHLIRPGSKAISRNLVILGARIPQHVPLDGPITLRADVCAECLPCRIDSYARPPDTRIRSRDRIQRRYTHIVVLNASVTTPTHEHSSQFVVIQRGHLNNGTESSRIARIRLFLFPTHRSVKRHCFLPYVFPSPPLQIES